MNFCRPLAHCGTAVANSVINKKTNDAKLAEDKRYHDELIKEIKGEGCSNKVVESQGLFLNPYRYDGNGIKTVFAHYKLNPIGQKTLRIS